MNIVITGGSGDMGKAIISEVKTRFPEATIYEINRNIDKNTDLKGDLSNLLDVYNVSEKLKKLQIDVFINCAGWSEPVPFEDLTIKQINDRVNINFYSPLLFMQAVLPNMKKRHKGVVINISSVTAVTPVPNLHIYSASKRALDSITVSLALEYSKYGIKINGIRPGSVKTRAASLGRSKLGELKGLSDDMYEKEMSRENGYDRLLDPSEVAKMVVFLTSDDSGGINGQIINVCGTMEVHS